jgi:alpha-tubulin suppressor-like RCC1 family protein
MDAANHLRSAAGPGAEGLQRVLRRGLLYKLLALCGLQFFAASVRQASAAQELRCTSGHYLREIKPVFKIAAGQSHTCSLHSNGDVLCWGQGTRGQLGYGDRHHRAKTQTSLPWVPFTSGDEVTAPITRPRLDLGPFEASQLCAGTHHSCAVVDDGLLKCWGISVLSSPLTV